jgi:hypothetical protein
VIDIIIYMFMFKIPGIVADYQAAYTAGIMPHSSSIVPGITGIKSVYKTVKGKNLSGFLNRVCMERAGETGRFLLRCAVKNGIFHKLQGYLRHGFGRAFSPEVCFVHQ